jgi:hypothetical protein
VFQKVNAAGEENIEITNDAIFANLLALYG